MRPLPWLLLLALLGSVGCGGGGGAGGGPGVGVAPPSGLTYAVVPALYRVDEPIADNLPSAGGDAVVTWAISPDVPAGLTFDEATGVIAGTPIAEQSHTNHTVTATNAGGQTQFVLDLVVGPKLPADVASLAVGFTVDVLMTGLATPSKIALAPDGRIFFNELKTGNVRVIAADGTLSPTPFATLTVQGAGGHQGLMGLVLATDFATSGHVYVMLCAPPDGGHATDHMRLQRFTDVAGVGTNETVILDNLPTSTINNGNDLIFDLTGNLFVSLGDVNVAANAQDPAVLAGKILRLTPTGAIPADNPDPSSPVFCLGLRNTYGLAVHPSVGVLFGVDNGPNADDELNLLQGGKNAEWGAAGSLGALAAPRLRVWQTEIVPTALAWHTGGPWGAGFANSLFIASYDDENVLRFEMSGAAFTDIDTESVFLAFAPNMNANKPLDLVVASDGSLYVSTYTSIYRIRPL